MIRYFDKVTPPADVKYAVYEMETVSANAKKEADNANSVWVTDEEAEAKYIKSLRTEKIKKVLITAAVCGGAALFLVSAYITIFVK